MQSSSETELASGRLNRSDDLRVVLVERPDNPPVVLLHWPTDATITTPHQLQAVAQKATNVLARATIALAQIRRDRKL